MTQLAWLYDLMDPAHDPPRCFGLRVYLMGVVADKGMDVVRNMDRWWGNDR